MSTYRCDDCDRDFTAPTDTDTCRCGGCGERAWREDPAGEPETAPARFRRTAEVEAVQWTGDNEAELIALVSPFDFMTIDPEDRTDDPDQTAAVRTHAHGGWVGLAPGDWVLKEAGHFSVCSDAEFRAAWTPTTPAAPADRTELRDRIARKLDSAFESFDPELTEDAELSGHLAGAVLAVLPADTGQTADRAAVLREAADAAHAEATRLYDDMGQTAAVGARSVGDALRRMADEAQPAEQPLVQVGWWCWRGNGHLAAIPCRSDSVPLHAPAEWADDLTAVIQRVHDGDEGQPAEAWPADTRWRVEIYEPASGEWVPSSSPVDTKDAAEQRMASAAAHSPRWRHDGTEICRRIVRSTTTHTVEEPRP